jgi:hypothetical protein
VIIINVRYGGREEPIVCVLALSLVSSIDKGAEFASDSVTFQQMAAIFNQSLLIAAG